MITLKNRKEKKSVRCRNRFFPYGYQSIVVESAHTRKMETTKKLSRKEEKIASLPRSERIERSLITTYDYRIWRKFTKALIIYDLIQPDDHIGVCISGGKDSMLMALLFKHLKKYTDKPFEVTYIVMDPGYSEKNINLIKENLHTLDIPAEIVSTDIFSIANNVTKKPCYLCARMRRGALYRIAKSYGCNKIALGHHYDDVIDTTLMNMLNAGSFQTMLPKVHSDHYEGMELIRPLYLIREKDIIDWKNTNGLTFLNCACKFTEGLTEKEKNGNNSQRQKTKELIAELMKTYSPMTEQNLFEAASNVNIDKVLGYKKDGIEHSFLDDYEENGKKIDAKIREEDLEAKSLAKAKKEHAVLKVDASCRKEEKK